MSVKPMKPENRINLIAELNKRFEEVEGGGGGSTVTAGKGIAVSYGEVSVDKGDGLKFDENKLSVDRDALNIPDPVYAGIATVLTASGNMNVLFDDNTIKLNSKGQLYANVSGGGGTVAAGDGITVSDNTVSVNKGDGLKFTDGALDVDRDALNIPDAVSAGEGIAVNGSAVAVDKGNGLKFVDNRLEVDRDALEIPDAVTAGVATEVTDAGAVNVLYDDDTIKVNSAGKLYANVSGGGGTVAAGDGITVSDNTVSVNKGDGLKFTDGALDVDRDALNIPDAVSAGEGIAVNGSAVAVDKGNGLKFVDNRLEVDRDALEIPDAVTAGVATEVTDAGAVNVLYDDDTIKVNSAGKLYANVSGGDTSNCVKKPTAQGLARVASVEMPIKGMSVTALTGASMVVVSAAPPADTGVIPENTSIVISDIAQRDTTSANERRYYGVAFKVTESGTTFSDVIVEEVNVGAGRGYKVTNVNECNGYNIVIPIYN